MRIETKTQGDKRGGRTETTRPVVAFFFFAIRKFSFWPAVFWPLERHAAEYLTLYLLQYNPFP